jgi:hypothetical protein
VNRFRLIAAVSAACALGVVSPGFGQGAASAGNRVAAPAAVKTGLYTCGSILSGSIAGSTAGMTIGQITILGPGVYTSLVKEGTGHRAAFSQDAATGKIAWQGGHLAGFFGKIVESRYSLDNRGRPVIKVTYRVRDGGNLFDLSCQPAAGE